MTTTYEPARTRGRGRWAAVAVAVVVVGGLLALLWAAMTAHDIASRTGTWIVEVPVQVTPLLPQDAWDWGTTGSGVPLWSTDHGIVALVEQADRATAAFAGAAPWVARIVLGLAALLLVPVVRALVSGARLTVGHAWRVVGVGVVVAIGWVAAAGLPALAAARMIADPVHGLRSEWFEPRWSLPWWPLLIAVLLVVLGLSVRRGASLGAEAEGLV
ncbi:hypothetical protein [Cellulomonas sp. URHE0023]|uniref:hypothetical protein n=1 Tax=Cellulomonas sp. URHE0023 TaxID=1380354 RepID=UPI0004874500|nr:hypothetical protein [Cellulomonas sp. URHE0023]